MTLTLIADFDPEADDAVDVEGADSETNEDAEGAEGTKHYVSVGYALCPTLTCTRSSP